MTSSLLHVPRLMTVLVIAYYLINQVSCNGTFQVLLQKFSSSSSCSTPTAGSSVNAPQSLLYFRVCLSNYKVSASTSQCSYGDRSSSMLPQRDKETNISSYAIDIDFDFSWPGSFLLVIEAKCNSTPATKSSDQTLLQMARNNFLSPRDLWSDFFYENAANNSRLDYSLRVVCAANNYGPNCSIYCKARHDDLGRYQCSANGTKVCDEGWTDPENYCRTATCWSNCNHGNGSCLAPDQCRCNPGWSGPSCDTCQPALECDPEHGTCQLPGECNCRDGWGGLYCRQDLQFCTTNTPCRNGGTCFNTGPDGFVCQCPPGFTGATCTTSQPRDCAVDPCINGATCKANEGGYECNCPPGYTGDICQTEIDDCQSDSCLNGGTCVDDVSGSHCLCPDGFSGRDCGDHPVDPCSTSPCGNSGTCYVDRLSVYRCICAPGLTGSHCEIGAGQSPNDTSNVTMTSPSTAQQLVVIICLGVLIPIVVIAITVVIWLVVRRRRRQQNNSSSSTAVNGGATPDGDNIRNDIKTLNNVLRPVSHKAPIDCPPVLNFKVSNLPDDGGVSGSKTAHAQNVSDPSSVDKKRYSDASFKQLNWTVKFERSDRNDLSSTYTHKDAIYCIDKSLERYDDGVAKTYSAEELRSASPHRFCDHSCGRSSLERYINDCDAMVTSSSTAAAAAAAGALSSSTETVYRTPYSTSPGNDRSDLHHHQSPTKHHVLHSTLV